MRNASWWLAGSLSLLALGCSGGGSSPATPTAPGSDQPLTSGMSTFTPGTAALGGTSVNGGGQESALAIFTVNVDVETLAATSSLKVNRSAQQTDDVYLLDISAFTTPSTFTVKSVSSSPTALTLDYAVTHPFKAPANLDAPATAANRADLGISGRVLFLNDVPTATGNTFFAGDGDVIANTDLLIKPHGYYTPAGLLDLTGFTANTFAYNALVDETQDPRYDPLTDTPIPNGGNDTGNYSPTDGWQRANMGANRNGWAGYGVLHQGQAANGSFAVDRNELLTGFFSLDVAIIAKYEDPRGGTTGSQKKTNRLPASPADVTKFVYREPHGALDVERVTFVGESGGFLPNQVSASTLDFTVVDWDATAAESSQANLADEPSPTLVAQGESGAPTLSVSIPGVLGTEIVTLTGTPGAESGTPSDPITYSEAVTKNVVTGQVGGTYKGMVRAEDVEVALDTTSWYIPLDGSASPPSPLASNLPEPIAYADFEVLMGVANTPPSATYTITTPSVTTGGTVSITINGLADADSDPVDILVDWDDDGTYTLATTANAPYGASIPLVSPITYTFSGSAPDIRDLPVRLDDGPNTVDLLPVQTFTVVSNACVVPAPVKTATNLTGNWPVGATDIGAYGLPVDATGATFPPAWFRNSNGLAAFRTTQINGTTAGFIGAYIGAPTTAGPGSWWEFLRITPGPDVATPGTSQIISNLDSTPTSPLTNRQVSDIEVTTTNRVLFLRRATGILSGSGSPVASYGGGGATAEILWFDFDGVTLVQDANVNIVTTAAALVAIAIDRFDDVYGIDINQVLRYYKWNGTTYVEQVTAPWPLDLKAAPINLPPNAGTGIVNHKVHDFVIDPFNGAFFILEENAAPVGANPLDARIYRVECDGTFQATINGNQNPSAPFTITDSSAQGLAADIFIDYLNGSGSLLGAQADVQIMVLGQNTEASMLWTDEYIYTSELQQTSAFEFIAASGLKGAISQNNNIYYRSNGTAGTFRLYFTPPAGWQ